MFPLTHFSAQKPECCQNGQNSLGNITLHTTWYPILPIQPKHLLLKLLIKSICVTHISFLPLIKWISQFLIKGELFHTYMNIWPYHIWQPCLRALPSSNHASQFHYAFSHKFNMTLCSQVDVSTKFCDSTVFKFLLFIWVFRWC